MDPLLIVILVVAVVLVLLFIGGYVANGRRREAQRASLHARVREADQHLAAAHAEDKGWERSGLEAAARSAVEQRTGAAPRELVLVQVVDHPGTDADQAVFHADGDELVLGRRDGRWVAL
jgi:hypothetical protein